jgi:hypothetical protein
MGGHHASEQGVTIVGMLTAQAAFKKSPSAAQKNTAYA